MICESVQRMQRMQIRVKYISFKIKIHLKDIGLIKVLHLIDAGGLRILRRRQSIIYVTNDAGIQGDD